MDKYTSFGEADTQDIAAEIAKSLKPGDIITLNGDLGAGKTAFVRGTAKYFGAKEDVTSPTFTLVNEYNGRLKIYHFDVYRLENPTVDECDWMDDYLFGDGICLIEWAENIKEVIPKKHIEVYITKNPEKGDDYREITFERIG